jgi:hypothetical protein
MSESAAIHGEIVDGVYTSAVKDALQIVIDEYYHVVFDVEPPRLTGIGIVGSAVDGTYTPGESDLDVYIYVDDPSAVDEDGLRAFMLDDTSFGYGATAEVTMPELSHVDLLGVLETGDERKLREPYEVA